MNNTRGGARPNAGRKRKEAGRTVNKSVCLRPEEWQALADAATDGSPNKEAARRLRASLCAPAPNAPARRPG